MGLVQQVVGNMIAEWSDAAPLKWTINESMGPKDDRRVETSSFNLSDLSEGYEESFLLELKNLLVTRRKRVSLVTIYTEYSVFRGVLSKVHMTQTGNSKVSQIDHVFLKRLQHIREDVSANSLTRFRRIFNSNYESPVYANDLTQADFPVHYSTKGQLGENIERVLARALSRATCVEILRRSEDAYEAGTIDIGCFSFVHLAFHIYCRSSSYQRITISDLQVDLDPQTNIKTYFIWIIPKKTRVSTQSLKKIPYRLDSLVGELLEAQRIHVIKTWGHLFGDEDIGKIAMFPARVEGKDGLWESSHARAHFGETTHSSFQNGYIRPIFKVLNKVIFNLTDLRHTVATQLAVAGCSATTIAAVLKHATPDACQKYVDIAFEGLINTLSDGLAQGFDVHFPAYNLFRSKNDPVTPEKAISSVELSTGRRELAGECGKTSACQYAPIACYSCPRFTPCFDADHGINLRLVEAEIKKYEQGGLPFQELINQYKDARRYILLVVASANQYQSELAHEGGVV